MGRFLLVLSIPVLGCASHGPMKRDDLPVVVRTSAVGGGVALVRDEPVVQGVHRVALFSPHVDERRVHWKFVAWCAGGQNALWGTCEARNADAELTSSFPETGVIDYQTTFGWSCSYAKVEPGDTVHVHVRCQ